MENKTLISYETSWIDKIKPEQSVLCGVVCIDDDIELNIIHNLNMPLCVLSVEVFTSIDGTDNNSLFVFENSGLSTTSGLTVFQIDMNSIRIQIKGSGIIYLDYADFFHHIDINCYYKVKVKEKEK